MLSQLVAGVHGQGAGSGPQVSDSSLFPLSKKVDVKAFERHVASQIVARAHVDVDSLAAAHLEAIVMGDNGLPGSFSKASYKAFDPVGTPQGLLEYLARVLEEPTEAYSRQEVADRIRWFSRVMFDPEVVPVGRAHFIKQVMLKYSASPSWEHHLDNDGRMLKLLFSDPSRPKRSFAGSDARPSTRPRVAARERSERSKAYCFGYSDQGKSCQSGAACRYRHQCASCGGSHVAAACRLWDPAKARANVLSARGH